MFVYCMNDPINMSDPTGNWPKWLKKLVTAFLDTVFVEFGFGYGLSYSGSATPVSIGAYKDGISFGIKNNQSYTSTVAQAEIAVAVGEEKVGIGGYVSHDQEIAGDQIRDKCYSTDPAWELASCPDAETDAFLGFSGFDGCVEASGDIHVLIGCHYEIGFDYYKFIQLMTE